MQKRANNLVRNLKNAPLPLYFIIGMLMLGIFSYALIESDLIGFATKIKTSFAKIRAPAFTNINDFTTTLPQRESDFHTIKEKLEPSKKPKIVIKGFTDSLMYLDTIDKGSTISWSALSKEDMYYDVKLVPLPKDTIPLCESPEFLKNYVFYKRVYTNQVVLPNDLPDGIYSLCMESRSSKSKSQFEALNNNALIAIGKENRQEISEVFKKNKMNRVELFDGKGANFHLEYDATAFDDETSWSVQEEEALLWFKILKAYKGCRCTKNTGFETNAILEVFVHGWGGEKGAKAMLPNIMEPKHKCSIKIVITWGLNDHLADVANKIPNILNHIIKKLKENDIGVSGIVVHGHSAGGVIASMVDFSQVNDKAPVEIDTYASPLNGLNSYRILKVLPLYGLFMASHSDLIEDNFNFPLQPRKVVLFYHHKTVSPDYKLSYDEILGLEDQQASSPSAWSSFYYQSRTLDNHQVYVNRKLMALKLAGQHRRYCPNP